MFKKILLCGLAASSLALISLPAQARVFFSVGVGIPGVVVAAPAIVPGPVVVAGPGFYAGAPYYGPHFYRGPGYYYRGGYYARPGYRDYYRGGHPGAYRR
jgi:hypothetical protein